MKNVFLLAFLLVCFLNLAKVSNAKKNAPVIEDVIEEGADDEFDEEDDIDDDATSDEVDEPVDRENPCAKKRCNRGEECILQKGKPRCKCISECSVDQDPRHKVCGSKNITFESECHLDQEFCYCKRGLPQCRHPSVKKLRLVYYGECKDLQKCTQEGAEQFPERMDSWLYVVMKAMAERNELDGYEDFVQPDDDLSTRINAIIWKFCDLDVLPHDRRVTKKELQFIVASFRPMEPCLVPFLNKCDKNDDRKISLKEWGSCLGLSSNTIQDKCKDIKKNSKN